MNTYSLLSKKISNYNPNPKYKHDQISHKVCILALKAAQGGNVGVGAILIDQNGNVCLEAKNEVFKNGFRSDLHAEMVLINKIEKKYRNKINLSGFTLISSLEPCPMCMTRIIFSGIGTIFYITKDQDGGMIHIMKKLPILFQKFIVQQNQKWGKAICSKELDDLSRQIWNKSKENLERLLTIQK